MSRVLRIRCFNLGNVSKKAILDNNRTLPKEVASHHLTPVPEEAVVSKIGPLALFRFDYTASRCSNTSGTVMLKIGSTQDSDDILSACKLRSPNVRGDGDFDQFVASILDVLKVRARPGHRGRACCPPPRQSLEGWCHLHSLVLTQAPGKTRLRDSLVPNCGRLLPHRSASLGLGVHFLDLQMRLGSSFDRVCSQ